MSNLNPDLAWYRALSEARGLPERCPLAREDRCPRWLQSRLLPGIREALGEDLDAHRTWVRRWRRRGLWGDGTGERATVLAGPDGKTRHYWNLCPEVAYERFGLFASHLDAHADARRRRAVHRDLEERRVDPEDWRWSWASITPLHYAACPFYLRLTPRDQHPKPKSLPGPHHSPVPEIRQGRPSPWGGWWQGMKTRWSGFTRGAFTRLRSWVWTRRGR